MENLTFIKKFKVPVAAYGVIDRMFTDEEIEFVSSLDKETFGLKDLINMNITIPEEFLQKSYQKGLISIVDENQGLYKLSDFYNRLDIFSISETDTYKGFLKSERDALDEWYFDAYYNGLDQNPEIAPTSDEVLPLEEVLDFIDNQERTVYLNYCDCRSLKGECGLPTKTCITYRNGINSFAHRGLSEVIDKERAKEIVKKADSTGLMHTVNPNGICNCCGDCCYLFRGQNRRNSVGIWPKAKYKIEFNNEKCIACGKCVKRCHFGVFTKDGSIFATETKCVGCGICIQGCPVEALKLVVR